MCERELAGVGRSGEEGADVERERGRGWKLGELEWKGQECVFVFVCVVWRVKKRGEAACCWGVWP